MEFSAFPKADRCPEESPLRRGPVIELPANEAIPASVIASFLDLLEQSILISDRSGKILHSNSRGRKRLASYGFSLEPNSNLFSDLLRVKGEVIANRIEGGE